jgi:hypothetical protein
MPVGGEVDSQAGNLSACGELFVCELARVVDKIFQRAYLPLATQRP